MYVQDDIISKTNHIISSPQDIVPGEREREEGREREVKRGMYVHVYIYDSCNTCTLYMYIQTRQSRATTPKDNSSFFPREI